MCYKKLNKLKFIYKNKTIFNLLFQFVVLKLLVILFQYGFLLEVLRIKLHDYFIFDLIIYKYANVYNFVFYLNINIKLVSFLIIKLR